jgi:hypothetical protein
MIGVARGTSAASTIVSPDAATIHHLWHVWLLLFTINNENQHPRGMVGVVGSDAKKNPMPRKKVVRRH